MAGAMLSPPVTPKESHCVLLGCFVFVLSSHNSRSSMSPTLPGNTYALFHKLKVQSIFDFFYLWILKMWSVIEHGHHGGDLVRHTDSQAHFKERQEFCRHVEILKAQC